MLVFGLLSTVFDLAAFALLLDVFHADAADVPDRMVRRSRCSPSWPLCWSCAPTGRRTAACRAAPLLWITLAAAILALALPYAGPLARAFDFVPLTGELLAAVLAIAVCYIAATEIAKRRFFPHRSAR